MALPARPSPVEVRLQAGLDPSWLSPAVASSALATVKQASVAVTPLPELYDDPQLRPAFASQPVGVTLQGAPDSLLLVARFSAWWQGSEFSDPLPLTSIRVDSLQGLDAEQARAMLRLFIETHVHESRLWLTDPTSLASALEAAKFVSDDPRARAECRAPCATWPWQTRWSVLEIVGRAAWREGDTTHDSALLDTAIARIREARRAIPNAAHPLTAAVTERLLSVALESRAELDPEQRDIDEALAASRRALAAFTSPELRVDRSITSNNLQGQLRLLAERDGSAARFDGALAMSKDTLLSFDSPQSPLAHAQALLLQAAILEDRYESLDEREPLTRARDLLLQALALVVPGASPLFEQRLESALCSASSALGRLTGDAVELSKGVQACERALALAPEVITPRAALSVSYGFAQCRLGEARGDAALLRGAVAQIRAGLAQLDARTPPRARAKALNNLAVALSALSSREDLQGNLELSGAAFEQALALSSKRNDPVRWAKNALGWAETERRLGWVERSQLRMDAAKAHYEKALRAIDDALTVLNPKNQATLWASLQERAGDVLAREGEIAEGYHFPQAVARYQLALRVNHRATDPAAYANTQFGLGVAYLFWADQSTGLDHIRGIAKKSVSAFREALAIRTQLGLTHTLPTTQTHLADAVAIVDRVSYRSTCEPEQLLIEAVRGDPKAQGLWETAAMSLERYRKAKDADKCIH